MKWIVLFFLKLMRPIRVLHVIKTLNLGGAEANLLNLAKASDPKRVEVHIAYSMGGELEERFRQAGARLFRYAARGYNLKHPASFVIVFRLWRYIRRNKIDVVHTHNFSGHVWGMLAAKLARVRVLEHVHDHRYTPREDFVRRWGAVIDQFNYTPLLKRKSDMIVVLTQAHKDYLVRNGYAEERRVIEQPNGLPLSGDGTSIDLEPIRSSRGIPADRRIILTACRIHPAKNIHLILHIASKVTEAVPDGLFVISGDGQQIEQLKAECTRLNLEDTVRFIGFYPQMSDLLRISELFLLPSLLELHSVAILEAMAAGIPVVTSAGVGSNDEFIRSWENGVLLDPFRDDGWAEAIIRLLTDEPLRRRIGEAGRRTCEDRFDIRGVASRFEDLYGQLCDR